MPDGLRCSDAANSIVDRIFDQPAPASVKLDGLILKNERACNHDLLECDAARALQSRD